MTEELGSRQVASAALQISVTATLEEEREGRKAWLARGVRVSAVNFGGEFIGSISKIIERTIVSAKREGVISDVHHEEGAVAGAAREALSQIMDKAIGLNVGGKITVARAGEHVSVVMFFGIGLLHLNEVAVGLGHRVL